MESVTSHDTPDTDLDRAARLSGAARRSTRWYRDYLIVFAVSSFVLTLATGRVTGTVGIAVVIGLWGVFLAVSSVWVARKPTAIRGMTRLHLTVMLGWTLAWSVTVVGGNTVATGHPGWWVLGALLTAASPAAGAVLAHRRTA